MLKLRKKQKGFTLTELAIVIAVIAILIAVLVPTFTSIINKANDSVDMQAAKNLNTTLSAGSAANSPENIGEVIDILVEDGYAENVTPYSSDCVYKWDKEQNVIVLYDTTEKTVLYPADYEGDVTTLYNLTYNSSEYGGFAYGNGTEESPYKIATLEHLESLRTLISTNKGADTEGKYFELTRNLDLGSTWAPLGATNYEWTSSTGASINSLNSNIFHGVLEGNGKTITINDSVNTIKDNSDFALFSYVGSGARIQNLNVEMNVKSYSCFSCGAIASYVRGDGADDIVFENITVTGTITAFAHGGGVVGWCAMGCTFKNCTNYANITTQRNNNYSFIGGISAEAGSYAYNVKDADGNDITADGSVVFESCANYGTLAHECTSGSGYYSIIGNMAGEIAEKQTTAIDSEKGITKCSITFNNCICEGKIYGIAKDSTTYCFEGYIYNSYNEDNTNKTTYDTTNDTANPYKLLIGGIICEIIVDDVLVINPDNATTRFGNGASSNT